METTSLGNPHQCSIILRKTKEVSSAWTEFPVPVCAVSCPITEHHWEEYVSITFPPPIRYLYTRTWCPWAVFSPGWAVPALTLSLCDRRSKCLNHLHSPSPHSLQCVHDFFWTGEPNAGPSSPGVASLVLSRGEGSLSPDLLAMLWGLLSMPLAFCTPRARCCLMSNLLPTQHPQILFYKAVFPSVFHHPSLYMGLFLHHFPLLDFVRFPLVHFSSLVEVTKSTTSNKTIFDKPWPATQ